MGKKELVREWFDKAENDFADARFLFENDRSLETIAFHIQQAAEKYLKGFLISRGEELERTHDLAKLLAEASEFTPELNQFKVIAKKITGFYFETRYPMGYEVEYSKKEIGEALEEVKKLIAEILKSSNLKKDKK